MNTTTLYVVLTPPFPHFAKMQLDRCAVALDHARRVYEKVADEEKNAARATDFPGRHQFMEAIKSAVPIILPDESSTTSSSSETLSVLLPLLLVLTHHPLVTEGKDRAWTLWEEVGAKVGWGLNSEEIMGDITDEVRKNAVFFFPIRDYFFRHLYRYIHVKLTYMIT